MGSLQCDDVFVDFKMLWESNVSTQTDEQNFYVF